MKDRRRITASLLVAVLAAMLIVTLPVVAQIPAPDSPSQQPAETVNLTMEDRHVIKEIILKDFKIGPPQDQAAKVPTNVGEVVPQGIPLQPMPIEVSAKVPQIKSHSFIIKDDKVVIIDPKDNKVAALVE
jgi:hypothetical protein